MTGEHLTDRFRGLPIALVLGMEVPVATGVPVRLLGLAWLDREIAGRGLLIPRCSSVHTFGMRFALDLVFLEVDGRPRSVRWGVPPRRVVGDRGAAAVLELPSEDRDLRLLRVGAGGEFPAPGP